MCTLSTTTDIQDRNLAVKVRGSLIYVFSVALLAIPLQMRALLKRY